MACADILLYRVSLRDAAVVLLFGVQALDGHWPRILPRIWFRV